MGLVGLLGGVGKGEQTAGFEHAGDFGGDARAHLGRQFVEEINARHRVEAGVGQGQVFGVGLDQLIGSGGPARFGEIGGRKIKSDQPGAWEGGGQIA